MVRERVASIIIRNKKILLVKDNWADFFSSPGGLVDAKENYEDALSRELDEELMMKIGKSKFYFSFEYTHTKFNEKQIEHNFIVFSDDEPKVSGEISEFGWFTKDDIQNEKVKTLSLYLDNLFQKLIEDGLL